MRKLLVFIVLAGCMALSALDIIKDGKPNAEIIVASDASPEIMLAARDLQGNLEAISGAKLNIATKLSQKNGIAICVGESEVTRQAGYKMPVIDGSGYDIWVNDKMVVLNGPCHKVAKATALELKGLHPQNRLFTLEGEHVVNTQLKVDLEDDCGAMHAVSAFLEELGVRFYGPSNEDTVRPAMKTVSVKEGRQTRTAAFARREYQFGAAQSKNADDVMWLKRLKCGSATERIGMLALASILQEDNGAHPEWLAKDKHNKMLFSLDGCGVPRYIEPGFQQACVKRLQQIFDGAPDLQEVILVPPASAGGWDYSEWLKMYRDESYYQPYECDTTLEFFRQVAKELGKTHPTKKVLWQSSAANRMFSPDNLKDLPANLGVASNHYAAVNYGKSGDRKKYMKATSALHNAFPKQIMQQREWWNEYACPATPRQPAYFMHALQEVRQFQKKEGFAGFLMDLSADEAGLVELPLTHLMIYVNSQLLWNPDLDLDALLNEYYTLYFGQAAPAMRNFFVFAESVASRGKARSICLENAQLKPEDVPVFFKLLNDATALVSQDSIYFKRIKKLEQSLDWMHSCFEERTPHGETLNAEILPLTNECDGNLQKYSNWIPLQGENKQNRTEIAVAFTEDRAHLMVAFRCYEKNMTGIKAAGKQRDDDAIMSDDHIKIQFNTNRKTGMLVAVNANGAIWDASADPMDINGRGNQYSSAFGQPRDYYGNGTAIGWNAAGTVAKVKRLADHWEGELCIDLKGCGNSPDYAPAWGFNVTRKCTNETQQLVAKGDVSPAEWRQLVLADRSATGEKVYKGAIVIRRLPGAQPDPFYIVKRTNAPVEFCKGWDEGAWKGIPELKLDCEYFPMGRSATGFCPDARAKIIYDDKYLYVQYQVKDRFVRGGITEDQDMVCTDSCMEFFIRPNGAGDYFNFECNCVGTLLLYQIASYGKELDFNPVALDELKKIERFHSLPRPLREEIKTPVTWYLGLKIPLDMFVRLAGAKLPLERQVWTANVFKCADSTTHPRWLTWQLCSGFHSPDEFGTIIFE